MSANGQSEDSHIWNVSDGQNIIYLFKQQRVQRAAQMNLLATWADRVLVTTIVWTVTKRTRKAGASVSFVAHSSQWSDLPYNVASQSIWLIIHVHCNRSPQSGGIISDYHFYHEGGEFISHPLALRGDFGKLPNSCYFSRRDVQQNGILYAFIKCLTSNA